MTNYIETVSTNEITGEEFRDINVQNDDGSIKAFPVDNSNSAYISFLRQLSEENDDDPHYVAWVEAGNNPEDFWTQDEALLTEGEEE